VFKCLMLAVSYKKVTMTTLPAEPIFVSYSRRDDEIMRRIAFYLRDQGFKVWVDNEKLIPGTPAWEEAIETAINKAFAIVVVLSPDSKQSEWVRREITYADQFNKRVFPVLVRGSEEESLPLRLVTRQFVDLRKNEEAGLDALVAAIQFYIGQKQTLEMKRPHGHRETVSTPPPAPKSESISASTSQTKKPANWILSLGIFFAVSILCVSASWIGYRALSPLLAPTQPEIATPTSAATDSVPVSEPPTLTPEPTSQEATPVTGSDILSAYLNDVEITHTDPFDDPSGNGWEIQNGEIKDGVLEIPGDPNYYGAKPTKQFGAGEGAVIDFTYPQNVGFEIYMESGDYDSSNYKRFGIFVSTDVIYSNGRNGKKIIGNDLSGNLNVQPGNTYSVFIAMLPNAEFLVAVWNPDDPSQYLVNRENMDSSWIDVDMTFYIGAGEGTIQLDNYREIKFSGAK